MTKRKWLIGAIILIAVLLAVWVLAQRAIGERLFDTVVAQRAGVDRTTDLPDGLHALVCGSGAPLPDANRAGPCIAVMAGRQGFIFDVGSGSMRKLGAMGFPMTELRGTFLTHLHSDHLDGLGEMMLQAWIAGGRSSPLPIYGPEGTERVVAGFNEAYDIDRGFRIAHHGPEVARPGGFGGEARVIADGVVYEQGGVTIRTIAVDHAPVDPALAFRIDYKGRSIVISGDTKYSEELATFARGSDVIFHEALNPRMVGRIGAALEKRGNSDGAKIMADIPDYHTSPEDAARVAKQAGAKALVLYHLVPAPPIKPVGRAFIDDAPDMFGERLELAEDGMLVSLPAEGQDVTFDQLL